MVPKFILYAHLKTRIIQLINKKKIARNVIENAFARPKRRKSKSRRIRDNILQKIRLKAEKCVNDFSRPRKARHTRAVPLRGTHAEHTTRLPLGAAPGRALEPQSAVVGVVVRGLRAVVRENAQNGAGPR